MKPATLLTPKPGGIIAATYIGYTGVWGSTQIQGKEPLQGMNANRHHSLGGLFKRLVTSICQYIPFDVLRGRFPLLATKASLSRAWIRMQACSGLSPVEILTIKSTSNTLLGAPPPPTLTPPISPP